MEGVVLAPLHRSLPAKQPTLALTENDLEAVIRSLTGHDPTEADLAAVQHLLGAVTPEGRASRRGRHR